jgi:energy-coupling factor transport system permease protein
MHGSILQSEVDTRGIVLDPRTKFLLLVTVAVFVLGGAGGAKIEFLHPVLCLIPFFLLIVSHRAKTALQSLLIYIAADLMIRFILPHLTGLLFYLVMGSASIMIRIVPGILTGVYVLSTTTVSEFTAAMLKMHISEKIIIPLSVMFRFFPTIVDEFSSINAAMRMRGISFGGGNAGNMLEYRLVPLMTCSIKIGEELSAAALTRGLGGDVQRTNVCRIGFHFVDIVVMVICAAPYVGLILTWCGVL